MTDKELNKIIAEFMGRFGFVTYPDELHIGKTIQTHVNYTESLDALVPVWEKLKLFSVELRHICDETVSCESWGEEFGSVTTEHDKPTVQQAAAHMTAKAIKGLHDEI